MLALQTLPDPISFFPDESALPVLTDRAMDFIDLDPARGERPERIAACLHPLFEIAPAEVISIWTDEIPDPTQTGRRQDKESVQFPADEEGEPLFTLPSAETSDPVPPDAITETAPSTQTGRRQDEESGPLPAEFRVAAVSDDARAEEPQATQTGRRQDQKIPSVLTDEVKAFIVRRLAHYETPTRIAAAVKLEFGIAITRRQVFAYDPTGSRPPAKRWIDLHAAIRAKFLRDIAEIGIAQQVVRLQMLDRFARDADDDFDTDRAAKFIVLAAKECGGFYERTPRPKAAA